MNIWSTFVGLLEQVLLTFQNWTGNAGVAIILFTILARLIILPLTLTSLRSSRKMQVLQPQMKELQRKYGKEPERLNQETMKLYRDNKVNPAGGCLPLILQIPVFFAVYQAVINLAQTPPSEAAARVLITGLNSAGLTTTAMKASLNAHRLNTWFLWLSDLGRPDTLYILPIISIVLQLLVQLMSTPRVQDAQQKAMTQSMLIMPIIFGYIGFTFPSGAVLYWVVGSLLSVLQTYAISGWGSLANYLKFLPTDAGLFPAPVLVTPSEPTSKESDTSNAPAATVEPASRRSFWDVLGPLAEQPTAVAATATADMTMMDDVQVADIAEVRRRVSQQPNPRRRKARR